jgi:uncharacterized protein YndB with AHSA1/START domain
MPDIMHFLKISAPPDRVYRAITTQDDVRDWWTREAELDSRRGEFRFYNSRVVTTVVVEALTPPAHVGWRTVASTASGNWAGTTITFDLRPDDAGTALLFAHRGFPEANEGFARVTTGWAYFLVSLQQYLETGEGCPAPDVDFARVTRR